MNNSVKKERRIIAIVAIIGSFLLALTIISCYFLSRYLTAQHGDIVVLYTNDVHGYFDKKLSYASIASIKQDLISQGKKVIVMDAGDHLSGSLYAIYDKGQTVMELMDEAGYDVATLGNHEFDHGFKRLDEVRHNAKYEYICSNLYHLENNKITTRYTDNGSKIFNIANRKIGVVGVATPNTISTSSPTHFQDEHGNYIYTFLDGNNGFDLYDNVQREVNSLKSRGCDYVIALTHLGNYDGTGNPMYTSDYLAKNTTGINIVIDGHSHHFIQGKYLRNKVGEEVIILQTGEYFEHIGKLMLSSNGELTNEFFSTYSRAKEAIVKKQRDFMHEVDDKYNAKIAHTDITFTRPDIANNNFGDFCADAFYYRSLTYPDSKNNPVNITFVNQGGIRVKKVEKGDWKLRTCRDIFTFDNTFIVRRMKGRLIKLALEWGARDMPGYCGAFLPCAGLRYKVNTSIKTRFVIDEGMYVAGPLDDAERIKYSDIEVFMPDYSKTVPTGKWEKLEPDKNYYVAGTNYALFKGGDGASFFKGDTALAKTVYEDPTPDTGYDYKVLANYVKNFKKVNDYPEITTSNSPLPFDYETFMINYENMTAGGGRVQLIE